MLPRASAREPSPDQQDEDNRTAEGQDGPAALAEEPGAFHKGSPDQPPHPGTNKASSDPSVEHGEKDIEQDHQDQQCSKALLQPSRHGRPPVIPTAPSGSLRLPGRPGRCRSAAFVLNAPQL